MLYTSLLAAALTATTVLAAPATDIIDKRTTSLCDSFDSLVEGKYTIYQNNWGAASATSGSQCTYFTSISGSTVVWSTTWSWAGGAGSVKSYSNVALAGINKSIASIKSIPSVWTWRMTGSSTAVADVSYDMWLAPSATADNDYEIMVWLGTYGGAGPISATGSAIATPTIGGNTYNLFKGTNGATTVFSFVSQANNGNFNSDLLLFFTYLTTYQSVSSSQVVTAIQGGTEPFSGTSVTLTNYAYSVTVN